MIELPIDPSGVPVIRTDFSDDAVWRELCAQVAAADYDGSGYEPNLVFAERADLASLDVDSLVAQIPTGYPDSYAQPFLIVVDTAAVSSADHAVLIVDLSEQDTSAPFRALPREIAAIEANLSIANMDFFEFADNVADDGVFRGFDDRTDVIADRSASGTNIPGAGSDIPGVVDVDDAAASEQRMKAAAQAGRLIFTDLEAGADRLGGAVGVVALRVVLPRPAARLYPLIANLDVTNMSTPNDPVVGNEFLISAYLPEDDGFVGPDGQILCCWTELTEPTRVSMTWAWMRTLPDSGMEDRLPRRATLAIELTVEAEDATILELVHDTVPVEWITAMTTIWRSKIDQWAYQSRPKHYRST